MTQRRLKLHVRLIPDNHGDPVTITPHQLRHTYATSLVNAGMSLQALMALLGHVTPEITLRYATLASPTLRDAYDEAMGKMRRHLTLTPIGRPIVPDNVSWLAGEMLKTRVAHGYCSRHEAQGACPYANICETCDNYTPGPEFTEALSDQLETFANSRPTPRHAAGPAKPNDTPPSPQRSSVISAGCNTTDVTDAAPKTEEVTITAITA
jgi:Phage integrase family